MKREGKEAYRTGEIHATWDVYYKCFDNRSGKERERQKTQKERT